jgi:hypothetical protein
MADNPPRGEIILDIAAERPAEFDGPLAGSGPGFDEQQLLLVMLADPDVAAALDDLDAAERAEGA